MVPPFQRPPSLLNLGISLLPCTDSVLCSLAHGKTRLNCIIGGLRLALLDSSDLKNIILMVTLTPTRYLMEFVYRTVQFKTTRFSPYRRGRNSPNYWQAPSVVVASARSILSFHHSPPKPFLSFQVAVLTRWPGHPQTSGSRTLVNVDPRSV